MSSGVSHVSTLNPNGGSMKTELDFRKENAGTLRKSSNTRWLAGPAKISAKGN